MPLVGQYGEVLDEVSHADLLDLCRSDLVSKLQIVDNGLFIEALAHFSLSKRL